MKRHAIVIYGLCALLLFVATHTWSQDPSVAASDFDGSGTVDFKDFVTFARGFGKSSSDPDFDARLDLNGNGAVDFADFAIFARNFGKSVSQPARMLIYISDPDFLETGGKIEVYDARTNLLDRTIPVPLPQGMAYSSINRQLYVTSADTFYAFTESDVRAFTIPLEDPPEEPGGIPQTRGGSKIALSADHRFAFVSENQIGQVEVIDLQQKQPVAQIPVGPRPNPDQLVITMGIVATSDEVYVGHLGNAIAVIDAAAFSFKDSIVVENMAQRRLALSPSGDRLYVPGFQRVPTPGSADSSVVAQILAIDPATRAVVDTLQVGDASDPGSYVEDLATSKDGAFLYATLNREFEAFDPQFNLTITQYKGKVVVVGTDSFKVAGSIEIPDADLLFNLGVSPDGKTAYAAGKEDPFEIAAQVFILDLEARQYVGPLRGFTAPTDIKLRSGKPALNRMALPEIVVF